MSLLEEIGAILGFVAFGGLAVLAFLTFQQGRELRRLRDWAGRAPERAAAQEGRLAPSHVAPAPAGAAVEPRGPSRLERLRGEAAYRYEEIDRRMPFDPRLLAGALLAIAVGVGIATSGFGLIGDDGDSAGAKAGAGTRESKEGVEVAVLNGTAPEGGVAVPDIASRVSEDVKAAGYKVGEIETAGSFPASVVMYEAGAKPDAERLASDLDGKLGRTQTQEITPEIESLAGGAPVALVIGQDDGDL